MHRRFHHDELTFSLVYAWDENFVLPLSHDEVVHGKRSLLSKLPGDRWQQLATLRALYGLMWAHPGKQLLFMGGELAEWGEWSEGRSLDWPLLDDPDHAGVRAVVRDLNATYRAQPALWEVDFRPEGLRLARRRRAGRERDRVRPLRGRRAPRSSASSTSRPSSARAGGCRCPRGGRWREVAQHRLALLRRLRRRQRPRDHGGGGAAARAAVLGARDAAAARHDLARARRRMPGSARRCRASRDRAPGSGCSRTSRRSSARSCSSRSEQLAQRGRRPSCESPLRSRRSNAITTSRSRACAAWPSARQLDDDGPPVGGVLAPPDEPRRSSASRWRVSVGPSIPTAPASSCCERQAAAFRFVSTSHIGIEPPAVRERARRRRGEPPSTP